MPHDWVFEVLKDLMAYAQRNELPALAARVEEAMAVAEAEIASLGEEAALPQRPGPHNGRPH
ncbi:hypothetical protein [Pseudogemmobacter blasticus]|uniref:Uncharacterized protein n=1 Tax=Fuscovulum blasticum DSM 2131 TaxID=1188250 RepID=A0A2T4JCH3_FUSBL|nr:hypothetical protein [Fuscovulum blasticum]PTE15527.1 hypothetical protein C5F44_03860 [Fuscovulum blasticum DSM 2131]